MLTRSQPISIGLFLLVAGSGLLSTRSAISAEDTARLSVQAQSCRIGTATIADVVAAVNDSVVHIEKFVKTPKVSGGKHKQQTADRLESLGSGFILRQDEDYAYILTNAHVIGEQFTRLTVTLVDGRKFPGTLVAQDKFTDVGVLKIAASGLTVAKIGSLKSMRLGDQVIAIGSPVGERDTVTTGIISAFHRFKDNVDMVQTSATINPGNSGGPLWNMDGEAIGMVALKLIVAEGISYAIPIEVATDIAAQLMEHGKAQHAWLGIKTSDRPQDWKIADIKEVFLVDVSKDGPAANAGLATGDVVRSVDGEPVSVQSDLNRILSRHKPGDKVVFGIVRNRETLTLPVTLGDWPDDSKKKQ